MAKGDHLYIKGLVDHHGIDCGDGTIIHYSASLKGGHGRITRVSKGRFSEGRTIRIKSYSKNYSRDEIVRRAEERLGKARYNIISNNCEHFVYSCTTGESDCYQWDHVLTAASGTAAAGLGLASTQVAAGGILGVIGVTVGLPATVIGGGAVTAGLAIYHGLRILGNWDDE
ncbi:lecithin retinol acyltransferase family protein [bacterium]|nr:lecithin retinol acyltransferase family protein [bacterium]